MELKVNYYKDKPPQSLHALVRQARQSMGYTQSYMAQCLKMSTRQYIKYETGQLNIADIAFQKGVNLCELLHIDMYELVIPIEKLMAEENREDTG